mmetsp:Transcript_49199/g.98068  ORF Transcript_49199/g.98068 Transcript_49199/m.98068 type:complete len:202 (+) Transcript_49199:589-1194(+)
MTDDRDYVHAGRWWRRWRLWRRRRARWRARQSSWRWWRTWWGRRRRVAAAIEVTHSFHCTRSNHLEALYRTCQEHDDERVLGDNFAPNRFGWVHFQNFEGMSLQALSVEVKNYAGPWDPPTERDSHRPRLQPPGYGINVGSLREDGPATKEACPFRRSELRRQSGWRPWRRRWRRSRHGLFNLARDARQTGYVTICREAER